MRGVADVGATIGVEEEFHIISAETGRLTPGAERLLAALPESVSLGVTQQEFQRSMIETSTPVCTDLASLRAAVVHSRREVIEAADKAGLWIAATGTVPDSGFHRGSVYPDARYRRISDEYRHLAVEQQVCACQVQVGVPDKDLAIRCVSRIRPWLPVLLALTAGSPFFQGADTGYASYRNIVTSRWPTGGPPPEFRDSADYEHRMKMLIESGVISDPGMIYYDVRPSHRYPTLEIRIADALPLVDDVVVLAALARALVMTAANEEVRGEAPRHIPEEIVRGATWKAARSGLGGMLVDPIARQPIRAPELLRRFVSYLEEALDESGEAGVVMDGIDTILGRGTSAERQRRSLSFGLGFDGVVAGIVSESRSSW